MSRRLWLFSGLGAAGLLGGALVIFNYVNAKPPRTEIGTPEARKAGAFDGERAVAYVASICEIGPRMSGSDGMKKQQELIQKHFEKHGATVTYQTFDARQPSRDAAVSMANMIVSWHPKADRRVIICGHYDTRPIADEERDRRDWNKPFVSANDGASSVAFMMELAHQMKDLKTEVGVDFVIFDGEEYIFDKNRDKYFLGSEHFAAEYKSQKNGPKYIAGILLDLFAGKGAVYPIEYNSALKAGPLVEDVWKLAESLGVTNFKFEYGPEVLDDHLALNKAGIPCIDIIDFSYEHWHKLSDTPDKCSAESMANVAKVLTAWMQKVK
jgi:glutaminyl-peptide cyclotransferase